MEDSNSLLSAPKYLTIAQDLKDKIQGSVYSVGDFLPPENDLVKIYSVSRPTIRAAIAKLREMGMLEVVHGRGTKVADHKIYQQIGNQLSFTGPPRPDTVKRRSRPMTIQAWRVSARTAEPATRTDSYGQGDSRMLP